MRKLSRLVLLLVLGTVLFAGCAGPPSAGDQAASPAATSPLVVSQGPSVSPLPSHEPTPSVTRDPTLPRPPGESVRVLFVSGLLWVNGTGPIEPFYVSCDAALGWGADLLASRLWTVNSSIPSLANANVVLIGAVGVGYRSGIGSCYEGNFVGAGAGDRVVIKLAGLEASGVAVDVDATTFSVGNASFAAGRTALVRVSRSNVVDGASGLLQVHDLGLWPRSNLTGVADFQDLPGMAVLAYPKPSPTVSAWLGEKPDGTYAYVRLSGTLVESGPEYKAPDSSCGGDLLPLYELPNSNLTVAAALMGSDVAHVGVVARNGIGVAKMHPNGCEWFSRLFSSNGRVLDIQPFVYAPTGFMRLERDGPTLRVDGAALAPGESTTVHVVYKMPMNRGDGNGTREYTYSGDVHVDYVGDWPRAGIELTPYGMP